MPTLDRVTVGQAAKLTGVSPKAIRLYERKRLLPPAERTEAGYRLFTHDDLAVLQFIRQAKTLGLTLGEIKDILDLQRRGERPCSEVTRLLDVRIVDIDRAIADLRQLRRTLATARRTADEARKRGEAAVVCSIVETDTSEHPEPARAGSRVSGGRGGTGARLGGTRAGAGATR